MNPVTDAHRSENHSKVKTSGTSHAVMQPCTQQQSTVSLDRRDWCCPGHEHGRDSNHSMTHTIAIHYECARPFMYTWPNSSTLQASTTPQKRCTRQSHTQGLRLVVYPTSRNRTLRQGVQAATPRKAKETNKGYRAGYTIPVSCSELSCMS